MITFCTLCRKGRLFLPTRVRLHVWRSFYKLTCLYDKVWNDSFDNYVQRLATRYNHLTEKLANSQDLLPKEIREYSSEVRQLKPTVKVYMDMKDKENDILEMKSLSDNDCDLRELVDEEVNNYKIEIDALQSKLLDFIVPRDEDDIHNAVLEVRAGVGGREAGIFASEVLTMYKKLSASKQWKFEELSRTENIDGGFNKAEASIVGKNVFGTLKHEIGVHRVQRIPITDAARRVHTSTIAVLVLPQPSDINIVLNMRDVKIDTFKATGAGGQHVNTTDSAVRMTHMPTGIVVSSQEERSQIQNRTTCIKKLTARIYDQERNRRMKEQSDARRSQVGSADRSERIRTYNFPQDRITDHRVGETIYGVDEFLSGGTLFLDLSSKLEAREIAQALLSLTKNNN